MVAACVDREVDTIAQPVGLAYQSEETTGLPMQSIGRSQAADEEVAPLAGGTGVGRRAEAERQLARCLRRSPNMTSSSMP